MKHIHSRFCMLVLLLFTGCSSRVPADFRQDLEKFLSEASRLNSLTAQGVNITSFGEQLATASSTFDLMRPKWPQSFHPSAKREFEEALEGWKLLYRVWRQEVSSRFDWTGDPKLISAIDAYAPSRIPRHEESSELIRFRPAVRVLMTIASEHFENGRSELLAK